MTNEPFSLEVTIAAPVDEVWNALRDPKLIRRWHGWHFDGLDEEIEVIYHQNVAESPAERRLEVQGGDLFELADLGGRTHLRVTRAPRGGDPEWDAYYDDISEGWITFVHQLAFALERHPDADRRTIFLSGAAATPVLEATGLAAAAGLPPASPYELEGPAGETLRGQVRFRTANQLGLTVDGWGDGLLIAAQNPPSPANPGGAAMMVLTTYGLDGDAFAALESRWNAWWGRHFPETSADGRDASVDARQAADA